MSGGRPTASVLVLLCFKLVGLHYFNGGAQGATAFQTTTFVTTRQTLNKIQPTQHGSGPWKFSGVITPLDLAKQSSPPSSGSISSIKESLTPETKRNNEEMFFEPPVPEVSLIIRTDPSLETETETEAKAEADYLPMLALCFCVAFLSALDRVAMSVAILPMSQEFHFTETLKGQISSVFSVGYGVGIIPCGLLIAAASPRAVMGVGVALWSVATLGTPIMAGLCILKETIIQTLPPEDGGTFVDVVPIAVLVENIGPLLAIRAVMGAAESVVLPAIQRIMAAWVPPSKKSLAVALIFTGFQVGTVCAYLASPIVMEHLGGWRGMFYLYGALGVAWLGPWLLLAKDAPPEVSFETAVPIEFSGGMTGQNVVRSGITTTADERELISGWDEAVSVLRSAPWHDFLTSRGAWAMTLAHAANNWGLYNSLSWTPTFYAEQYGLNVRESAFLSVLPSVAGAIGGLFAGTLADAIITKTSTSSSSSSSSTLSNNGNDDAARTVVRKVFQGIALLGPAACLLTLAHDIPTEPLAAQALLTGTVGLQAFNAAGYGASAQEKAGQLWSGLLYSLTSLPGVIVGSVGVYATGQILDATHQDWSTIFGLNAAINIVGAIAFITLYDSKKEFD
eukprot:scaffold50046_cov46-Attheya_sp.AAC.1